MEIHNVPFTGRIDQTNEAIERKFDKWSERIRVAIPGIIQSFDANKQTVSVKVTIREKKSFYGKPFENIEIPQLDEVPILVPRAGNFILTMPIKEGDECLLVFADNCYDSWWESGKISNQLDNRRHDLSDAFAIIGIWSQPNIISNYSTDSARLRNLDNTVYIEMKDEDINIEAKTKISINAPTVEVTGDNINVTGESVKVQGSNSVSVDANSKTTIEGRNFLNHKHLNGGGIGLSGGVA